MNDLVSRMVRAAKLEADLYEEVEADPGASGQALVVVVLSALAAGIGYSGAGGITSLIGLVIVALVSWYVWAFLTFFVGTKLLPGSQTEADMGQLLRTIGFASSPGVVRLLGVVPGLSVIILPVTFAWMLVAMVVAVRQALDYENTWRAVLVVVIGWAVQTVIVIAGIRLLGGFEGMEPGS